MAIRKLTTGESCELVVPGRIDGALANQLEIDILAAIREGFNSIYVNLAEASFLCSAGMRVLLQYHRQMKNNKKTLLVTRPSPEVDSILELTGFRELIVEGAKPQGAVCKHRATVVWRILKVLPRRSAALTPLRLTHGSEAENIPGRLADPTVKRRKRRAPALGAREVFHHR